MENSQLAIFSSNIPVPLSFSSSKISVTHMIDFLAVAYLSTPLLSVSKWFLLSSNSGILRLSNLLLNPFNFYLVLFQMKQRYSFVSFFIISSFLKFSGSFLFPGK